MAAEQEEFDLEAYFRFLELFDLGNEQFDIGSLRFINPKLHLVLEVVSDQCVSNFPNHEYIGPDGTLLRLENWQEKRQTALQADDGVLRMPQYRFRRITMGNPWERATYIQAKVEVGLGVRLFAYRGVA